MKILSCFSINSLILFICLFITSHTLTFAQATFIVNSTLDTPDNNPGDGVCNDGGGNCTLRAAMEEANALAGRDSLAFNIAGVGPFTFSPITSLPFVTEDVIIDASTQGGYTIGNPQIVIDGSGIATGASGFNLQPGADDCVIRGFCIGGFLQGTIGTGGFGIRIFSNNNVVAENFIGLAADGVNPFANEQDGILIISAASDNLIGGNLSTDANVISGNIRAGINLTQGFNNNIQGNLIGTDKSSNAAVPNTFGIFIAFSNNSGHLIGGTLTSQRNIISGNTTEGINVIGGDNFDILGNYIGTDSTGTVAVPNQSNGIFLFGSGIVNVNVGNASPGGGNLISGNGVSGIRVQGLNNLIAGNLIGTQADGTTALGNGEAGIHIEGQNNVIGSVAANVIAHHPGEGIRVETSSFPAVKNLISQNSIHDNGVIGIDLGYNSAAQGQTANDVNDADGGPNFLQNYADILLPAYNDITNVLNLTYSVVSDPANTNYPLTVEFFIADANGQGRTFIGSDIYTVGDYTAGPEKSITFTPLFPLIVGEGIANTVTAADSNTSEFNSETVLPLTHTFLAASLEEDAPLLKWNGLPEDMASFELERGTSQSSFVSIRSFVFPEEDTFSDLQALAGANKYRLKILHTDGQISYSNIASVWVDKPLQSLNIYPNPAKSQLFIELPNQIKQADYKIFDLQGRLVLHSRINTATQLLTLDISDLPKGMYWIRMNGSQISQGGRFVKH